MTNPILRDVQINCANCSLDEICIPRGLSSDEIIELSHAVQTKRLLQKGEFIYRQGDEFKGIMAIQSGTAKLIMDDVNGDEHILRILLPGELLGFDGLSDQHYCSAVALTTLSVCILPGNQMDILCQQVPNLMRELFRHNSETLKNSQERIVINKQSAEVRMAKFLIDLSERLKKRGFSASDFILTLTREEIGNHLGLALETVSRLLKQFQNQELITVKQKQISIKNIEGLKKIETERSIND